MEPSTTAPVPSGHTAAGGVLVGSPHARRHLVVFEEGVRDGRYEPWVVEIDRTFAEQDPEGTPAALLDGRPVDPRVLYDPEALGVVVRGG